MNEKQYFFQEGLEKFQDLPDQTQIKNRCQIKNKILFSPTEYVFIFFSIGRNWQDNFFPQKYTKIFSKRTQPEIL